MTVYMVAQVEVLDPGNALAIRETAVNRRLFFIRGVDEAGTA